MGICPVCELGLGNSGATEYVECGQATVPGKFSPSRWARHAKGGAQLFLARPASCPRKSLRRRPQASSLPAAEQDMRKDVLNYS